MLQPVQVQPSTPPPKLTPQQVSRSAMLILIVLLVGLFGLVALIYASLMRRRARTRELERRAKEPPPPPRIDAWAEAGRRAATPPAGDLDDTRVPLDAERGAEDEARRPTTRPVALVTGGARRVGRAIVLELARCGCDVHFTYHDSDEDAARLAREVAALESECTFFQLDLSDPAAVDAFARERADTLPAIDILVHNASQYEPSPLGSFDHALAAKLYQVNALAPLAITARLAEALARSQMPGGGAVVAMADIHAMGRPRKDYAAYSMSKAALVDLVHSLARDLAPHVRVNGVAPGVVAWPEAGPEAQPEAQARYLKRVPMGRTGTPEEAARAVRWLALEATYTTGEVIRVDGGRWLT